MVVLARRLFVVLAAAATICFSPTFLFGIDCQRVDTNNVVANASAYARVYGSYTPPPPTPTVVDAPSQVSNSDPSLAVATLGASATNLAGHAQAQTQNSAKCPVAWGGTAAVPQVDSTVQVMADFTPTRPYAQGFATCDGGALCNTLFQPVVGDTTVVGSLYFLANGGNTGGGSSTSALWAACNNSWVNFTTSGDGSTFSYSGRVGYQSVAGISPGGVNLLFTFEEDSNATITLSSSVSSTARVGGGYPDGRSPHSQWDFIASAWFHLE
jgi:hypothetical protein